MGFEVYLAIDEFSWSKKTLPHMLRKAILAMTIADEEGLYIFPDDISINIANPHDLRILSQLFEGRELYVAVGSDVVLNASSYKKKPEPYSIHSFNHLVFARAAQQLDEEGLILFLPVQRSNWMRREKTIRSPVKSFSWNCRSTMRISVQPESGRISIWDGISPA